MRKLILQMQLSIDGYVAGPGGQMDWMTWTWDNELKDYVTRLTGTMDTILLGRNMPEGFVGYWKSITDDPTNEQYPFAKIMCDTPKIVFSKTVKESTWDNTIVVNGDITKEVNELKKQAGKDIIVYGGANFVSNLIKNNLIDEYYLFVNPVAIGEGMAIFNKLEERLNLQLIEAIPFACGITAMVLKPA